MRSTATALVLLLCLVATGGQASADPGSGSTVVRTVFRLWKGWSAEAAKSAPLVSVSQASTAVAVLPAEPALDLLFTGEDAPVDRHSHKRPPLHVLTKYVIKPSTGKDFVETFLGVAADVNNETGSIYYKLFKTASDDLIFYSYQVWATAKDFFEHIKSDAVKPLGKLIVDEDIPIFVTAVLPIRHAPHPPHHGPHGPHGPHDGPHGPHHGPHGPHDGPHGPHHGPHGGHDGPHGPHHGPHDEHPHRHGRHGHDDDDDHHGPHHGPHGHGEDHGHHPHHHMQHEHAEGSQDLDWMSAIMQPAHAHKDVLADTARTALDNLAEQGTSGRLFGSDAPEDTAGFDLDWEEGTGTAAVEAEQKEAETWRHWDRKLLHRRFVDEPESPLEHGDDEQDDEMEEWESSVLAPPALHMMAFDDSDGNKTHGNHTHYHPTVLTKFVVRPSLARFFVGAYMLLKERVSEEKGNLVFGLAKPLSDNLVFYGNSKWEGPCAIKKHVRKPYARKFAAFIAKANIPVEVTLLAPIEKKTNTTMMLPAV